MTIVEILEQYPSARMLYKQMDKNTDQEQVRNFPPDDFRLLPDSLYSHLGIQVREDIV